MTTLLVGLAVLAMGALGFWCGHLHAEYVRAQAEPERPADWAVDMARRDPQRLLNVLREGRLP